MKATNRIMTAVTAGTIIAFLAFCAGSLRGFGHGFARGAQYGWNLGRIYSVGWQGARVNTADDTNTWGVIGFPKQHERLCGSHLLDCPDMRWFNISWFAAELNTNVEWAEIGVCTNCWKVIGSGRRDKTENIL